MKKELFVDKTLGIRLKQVRDIERYTIEAFSEILGINAASYGNYERGLRRMPEKMGRLLNNKFGVSEIWFLTGFGQMKADDKPKGLPSDMRELKEMILSMQARVKYLENMYLKVMETLSKKGI